MSYYGPSGSVNGAYTKDRVWTSPGGMLQAGAPVVGQVAQNQMPLQPGQYRYGAGAYDAPPAPMAAPMQAPQMAPMVPPTPVSSLQMGGVAAQDLLRNAMAGGGASIQDILARVAQNQKLMQSTMQPPASSVGYAPRTY